MEPWVRRNHDLLRVGCKPRSPPAQRRIGNDVMAASRHQAQLFDDSLGPVRVDQDRAFDREILSAPEPVVGKYIELRIPQALADQPDGSIIIGSRTKAVMAGYVRLQIVSAPHMQADGIRLSDAIQPDAIGCDRPDGCRGS